MIKLLDLKKFSNKLTPVTTPEYFSGTTSAGDFHPNGVYSETIFGPLESKLRMTTYSYIDLNVNVIHPVMWNILYRLDRKIVSYISTMSYFDITKSGELIEVEDGMTGLSDFRKYFKKIKFRGGTADRDRLVALIDKSYNDGNLFINKLPIVPPYYREIYQDQNGQWTIDELNEIYVSIIRKTLSIKSQNEGDGVLADLLFFGVQKTVNGHHEFIKNKIEKKKGLIRNKLMGKRVDFSGFGVITTEPSLKSGQIGIPVRMAVSLFEPFLIFLFLRSGRYQPEYLADIFNDYKQDMELTVENLKMLFKSVRTDNHIPERVYALIKEACEIVGAKRKVIAKRDPVLLPESYQGYNPIIVDGDTIRICPTHVGGHNADFDGDTFVGIIRIYDGENIINSHISEFKNSDLFEYIPEKEKENVSHYKPTKELYIDAIDLKDGHQEKKLIQDYTEHRNVSFYRISDSENRFKDFHVSDDHSLIIYDSITDVYEKISPIELLKNPDNKFLIQKIE